MSLQNYFATYKHHYAIIIRLGIPLLLGQLGIIVTGYADTIMVGNYSTDALASASFANSVIAFVLMLSIGFSYGLTPLVGALFSSGSTNRLAATVRAGVAANVAYVALWCVPLLAVYVWLDRLGLPTHLLPVIRPYFMLLLVSLLPLAVVNALRQFTDAINDTKVSMYILVCGNALNIVLNYALIYGHLGLPELGLTGAGIATLASRVAMLIAYVAYLLCHPRYRCYRANLLHAPLSGANVRTIVVTSLPISLQIGMETGIFTAASVFAGRLGTNTLAAVQVLTTIGQLGFMVYYSLGAAASIKIANYLGVNDTLRIRQVAHAGYMITLASAVVASMAFYFGGEFLAGLFTNDAAVVALVSSQIGLLILYQFGDATQIAFSNGLRGIAHVKPIMGIAFVSYIVVGIPVMYALCFPFGFDISGIYLAHTISLLTAGLWFRHTFSKHIAQL
ncbi:MAG: MATE family efflux transporter [Muribaculaceae bacterium]